VTNDPGFGEDGTQNFTLNGTAIETNLSVGESAVGFGVVGNNSTNTREVTLTGDTKITGLNASLSGTDQEEFAVSIEDEEGNISANASTTLSITYAPTTVADHSARVNIESSDATASIVLSGRSTPPDASSPDDVQFGFVPTDEPATETVTISNLGNESTTLNITDVSLTGADANNFSLTSGTQAPFDLSGGESQAINIEFPVNVSNNPDPGSRSATLTINTTDPDADQQQITVNVEGSIAVPDIQLDRSAVEFGDVPTNTTSEPRIIGVVNNGTAELDSDNVTVDASGPFDATQVTQDVVPGGAALVAITPNLSSPGSVSEQLDVTLNDETRTADLNATGIQPELAVEDGLSNNGSFGDVPAGNSNAAQITLNNTGNQTLQLSDVSASGPFDVTGSQTQISLASGETTTLSVTFAPDEARDGLRGNFTLDTNDPNNRTFSRELSGNGTESNASVSPAAVNFGEVPVGESSSQDITIENTGDASHDVTDIVITGGPFTVDNPNSTVERGTTLASGESGTIVIE
jgi:hypothetical protein